MLNGLYPRQAASKLPTRRAMGPGLELFRRWASSADGAAAEIA